MGALHGRQKRVVEQTVALKCHAQNRLAKKPINPKISPENPRIRPRTRKKAKTIAAAISKIKPAFMIHFSLIVFISLKQAAARKTNES